MSDVISMIENLFGFKGWAILIILSILFGIGWHTMKAYALDDKVYDIAYNISLTPYDVLKYNCWDFSTDLYTALKKEGFKPRIIIGTRGTGTHAWVELNGEWIDGESGQVIYDRSGYIFPGFYALPKYNPFKAKYLRDNFIR